MNFYKNAKLCLECLSLSQGGAHELNEITLDVLDELTGQGSFVHGVNSSVG